MTWDQIREAGESGFVEIASHSHGLHQYETCNPYNDTSPSVTTRRYLSRDRRYEDRDEYRWRIRHDLHRAKSSLEQNVGRDVSVLAWPYGEHNAMARELARQEGFPVTLGLEGTDVRREDLVRGHLPRVMVTEEMNPGAGNLDWLYPRRHPVRAAQADLDAVYDPDPAIFRGRVDRLVRKIRAGREHRVPSGAGRPGRGRSLPRGVLHEPPTPGASRHLVDGGPQVPPCRDPRLAARARDEPLLGMGAPPRSGASPSARNAGRRPESRGTSASPRTTRGHGRRRSTFSATSPSTSPSKGSCSTTTPT